MRKSRRGKNQAVTVSGSYTRKSWFGAAGPWRVALNDHLAVGPFSDHSPNQSRPSIEDLFFTMEVLSDGGLRLAVADGLGEGGLLGFGVDIQLALGQKCMVTSAWASR